MNENKLRRSSSNAELLLEPIPGAYQRLIRSSRCLLTTKRAPTLLLCPSRFVFIGDDVDKDMVKNALYLFLPNEKVVFGGDTYLQEAEADDVSV